MARLSRWFALFSSAWLVPVVPAHATLLGDDIGIQIDLDDPHSDVVIPSVEVQTPFSEASAGWSGPLFFAFGSVVVDVDDSSLWITIQAGTESAQTEAAFAPGMEFWLTDLDWVGQPGYVIDQVIPQQGNTADVTVAFVGPNEIHLSYPGEVDMSGGNGFLVEAHFDITHRVPEPSLLALTALAIGLWRLRRGG